MRAEDYIKEFIGSRVVVKKHDNKLYENMQGEVIDETYHTFLVDSNGKRRIVPKDHGVFVFSTETETFEIQGALIDMRPEDRLKNMRKFKIVEERGHNNGSKHWN